MTYGFKVKPVGKPRMTQRDKWLKRPAVMRYREYADALREQADKMGFKPTNAMNIVFEIPMPKSWSKKKRAKMLGAPHDQKPDIDNLLKSFLDALLLDDKKVHTIKMKKFWAKDGRILVTNIGLTED